MTEAAITNESEDIATKLTLSTICHEHHEQQFTEEQLYDQAIGVILNKGVDKEATCTPTPVSFDKSAIRLHFRNLLRKPTRPINRTRTVEHRVNMITVVNDSDEKPPVQTHNVNVINGRPLEQLCANPAWPVTRLSTTTAEPSRTATTRQPMEVERHVQHASSSVPPADRVRARQLLTMHQRDIQENEANLPSSLHDPIAIHDARMSPVARSTRTFGDTIFGEVESKTPTRVQPTASPRRIDPTMAAINSDHQSRQRDSDESGPAPEGDEGTRSAPIPRRFQQEDPYNLSMGGSRSRDIGRGSTEHPLLLSRVTRSGNSQYSGDGVYQGSRTGVQQEELAAGATIGHVMAVESRTTALPIHPTRIVNQTKTRGTESGDRHGMDTPNVQTHDAARAIAGHLLGLTTAPFEIVTQSAANAFMRIRHPESMGTNRMVRFGPAEIYDISRQVYEHRSGVAAGADRHHVADTGTRTPDDGGDSDSQPPPLCTGSPTTDTDSSTSPPSLVTPSDSDDEETPMDRQRRVAAAEERLRVYHLHHGQSLHAAATAHIFTTNGGGDAAEDRLEPERTRQPPPAVAPTTHTHLQWRRTRHQLAQPRLRP